MGFAKGSVAIRSTGKIVLSDFLKKKRIASSNKFLLVRYERKKFFVQLKAQRFVYKGTPYRGNLILFPKGGKRFLVVNEVPLEDYLLAVVPSEMPAKWDLEALRVQAVCARTYAFYNYQHRFSKLYDVDRTVKSQVYGGILREHPRSSQAVRETTSMIIFHKNKPIESYFHSNSGGITIPSGEIWPINVSYTKSTLSYDYFASNYYWKYSIPLNRLTSQLSRFGLGKIDGFGIHTVSAYGKVKKIQLKADTKQLTIPVRRFRQIIGFDKIRSLNFVSKVQDDHLYLWGFGYGHGVGLSQWGAYAMVKKGYKMREIIQHYYHDVRVGLIRDSDL
ncbi:MAG: SpoIID/LytB domain-containing protein [Spirochaetota bacterium]